MADTRWSILNTSIVPRTHEKETNDIALPHELDQTNAHLPKTSFPLSQTQAFIFKNQIPSVTYSNFHFQKTNSRAHKVKLLFSSWPNYHFTPKLMSLSKFRITCSVSFTKKCCSHDFPGRDWQTIKMMFELKAFQRFSINYYSKYNFE